MGEVYLAQDTKLDRKVAIKFLNEEFSKDEDKLSRFFREAKAASALNHPNILTVYEIGEVTGRNYIATELIDGTTLRRHLAQNEPLPLNTILKIGVQVAEALAAAHQAGIIHRDIKPENIMIRRDGYAKVLDFGLAKLSEPGAVATGSSGTEDPTRIQVNTNPGVVMGTVSYMSPEQARGNPTDARTDIWSLGVVLYEMLARKVPFTGDTTSHTIVSILEKEPLALENVPAELQRIVRKALTKDLDMRYQSARDLLIDLKNLRRDLDIQGELERSIVPHREAETNLIDDKATKIYASGSLATHSAQTPAATQQPSSASSLEYAVTQAKSHKLLTAIVALVLLGVVVTVAYFAFVSRRASATGQIESIAVLPFENQNHDPNSDYLSDGVTESIINSLTQLPNLRVIARSSVFRYKGKETDPFVAGKDLGVRAVLVGRMMQRGDTVTVSTELVDVRDNKQLWGEQYNEQVSDLVSLPRDIASKITSNLRMTISGEDRNRMMKHETESAEAFQLYLKGRYYWNKRGANELRQAAQFYSQAIEKDPSYALAYAGLAETYSLYPDWDVASPADSFPKSKAAAMRALELDNSLAEPHTALGRYYNFWEWNRAEAEREYRRAIELKPNYATAHHWLATDTLTQLKRFDEALVEVKRAAELDPLSAVIASNFGDTYMYARRYDEALAQYQRALAIDQNFYTAYESIGEILAFKGRYQESIAELQKGLELSGGDPLAKAYLAFALGKSGKRAEAQKLLDEIKHDALTRYVPSYAIAMTYIGLGQKDEALSAVLKNADAHDTAAAFAAVDPMLDDLRSDPRFPELLKRVGLTP